jgi:hypothetical protein
LIGVFVGNDATAGEQNIVQTFIFHEVQNAGENGVVGSAENANPNGVNIFLQCRLNHHFWGLAQASIDYLHAGISQSGGNDFGSAIVPIETDFGYQNSNRARGSGLSHEAKIEIPEGNRY